MTLRPQIVGAIMLVAASIFVALMYSFTGSRPLVSFSPVTGPVLKLAAQLLGLVGGVGLATVVYGIKKQMIKDWVITKPRNAVVGATCVGVLGMLGFVYFSWGVEINLLHSFSQGVVAGMVLATLAWIGKTLRTQP